MFILFEANRRWGGFISAIRLIYAEGLRSIMRGSASLLTSIGLGTWYIDQFETKSLALKRERQLKGWSRAKKEALIRGDEVELKRLSRRRN